MDEAKFWRLMDEARAESNGDEYEQMKILATKLEALPVTEIIEYERLTEHFFDLAYTWDLWAAGYILNGGCSDDGFEYFRGWLIAQGKDAYYTALSDPETLADLQLPDTPLECEATRVVASWAYKNKTGEEMDTTTNTPWTLLAGEPTGERFDEDTVDEKYPKLAAAAESRTW